MINRIRQIAIPDAIKRILGLTVEPGVGIVADEFEFNADLYQRPEFWALMGGDLGSIQISLAAGGVGFRSQTGWRNPTGSGEIGIIESCLVHNTSGAAQEALLAISRASIAAATVAQFNRRDLRGISRSVIQTQQRMDSQNGIALAGIDQFLSRRPVATLTDVEMIQGSPIIIGPGWTVRAMLVADNQPTNFIWTGRFRRATDAELELGRG